jgi:hypothetical protein
MLVLAAAGAPAWGQADDRTAARDRAFAALLTGAELRGFFTSGEVTPDRPLQEDSYEIRRAAPVGGDFWEIEVRIRYGDNDVTVPLRLKVLWAGDTPVITVTDLPVPGLGVFTSRVLFHGNDYAGTWSAGDHGGQMFGRVLRAGAGDGGGTVNWPSFRGPSARGISEGFATAATWDVEAGTNVRWSTPIAGLAHSAPVVWGDRVYVTSAVRAEEGDAELTVGLYGDIEPVEDDAVHRFVVHAIDKTTGDVVWTRHAWEGVPAVKRHPKGSHAASTPATDGAHVVAFFGTEGLYCYDADGELAWKRDFGRLDSGYFMVPDAQWGFASSPVIHEDLVLVQCDVQGDSFIAALALDDGSEVWRTPRDEVPTWGTPTVDVRPGRSQVIANGWKHIGGYDLRTGTELWRLRGGGDIPVPTPVVAHDLVFITNAHGRQAPIYAIDVGASGDITDVLDDNVAWWRRRRGNYMQTPLVHGDYLYCCADAGILACYEATTGREIYRERLAEGRTGFTASPVAADGKLYLTAETGEVHVVALGPEFEVLAVNDLGEECLATPAISEGVLLFRARRTLFAVGDRE